MDDYKLVDLEECDWWKAEMDKFKTDPQYIAESCLTGLTESICKIKQPAGIDKLLFRLMENLASRLIWDRKP